MKDQLKIQKEDSPVNRLSLKPNTLYSAVRLGKEHSTDFCDGVFVTDKNAKELTWLLGGTRSGGVLTWVIHVANTLDNYYITPLTGTLELSND